LVRVLGKKKVCIANLAWQNKMNIKLYCLIVCLAVFSRLAIAQSSSDEALFSKVSDNLAVINVNGTNVGVLSSDKGLLLIDPAIREEDKQDFLEQIRSFSDRQLKYVVNTHGDIDHGRGNKIFTTLGASVLSSGSARYSPVYTELTFDAGLLLDLGSHQLKAASVKSHTQDDWVIHIPEENTIFTGDVFTNSGPPSFFAGGFIGQQRAINTILSLANEQTRIVPGHGAITTIEQVRTYLVNASELYNRVRTLHQAGSSIAQIEADADYQAAMLRFNSDNEDGFLNRQSVSRFVSRVISSEFVEAQEIDDQASQLVLGSYALNDRSIIEVILENDTYYARKKGGFLFELIPQSNTRFHIRGSLDGVVTFGPNSRNTRIRTLELDVEGTLYSARKRRN